MKNNGKAVHEISQNKKSSFFVCVDHCHRRSKYETLIRFRFKANHQNIAYYYYSVFIATTSVDSSSVHFEIRSWNADKLAKWPYCQYPFAPIPFYLLMCLWDLFIYIYVRRSTSVGSHTPSMHLFVYNGQCVATSLLHVINSNNS